MIRKFIFSHRRRLWGIASVLHSTVQIAGKFRAYGLELVGSIGRKGFFSIMFSFYSAFAAIQQFAGYDNFINSAELFNITVTTEGKLRLGPKTSLIFDTQEPYVWSLTSDQTGNVFIGTGSDGKIFRINLTQGNKGEIIFDSEETEILCLTCDGQGNLYAGTAPNGLVYKISPNGRIQKFFETNESYVFSLVFDDKGYLYLGSGDKGNIYRIDQQGKGKIIFDASQPHITTLAFSSKPQPTLFAGSAGQGLIYKITNPASEPMVMTIYDAPEDETRAILIADEGDLYCAFNPNLTKLTLGETQTDIPKPAEQTPKLYQLTSDGLVKQSWQSSDSLIFVLQKHHQEILVGTGNSGKVYLLDKAKKGKGLGSLALVMEEPQITALCLAPSDGILIGTSNPGRVYQLKSEISNQGWVISRPFDSKSLSEWGRLSFEAEIPSGCNIEFQTRSGNSEKPDETWSKFQPISENGAIQSPRARFLQWQAIFSSNGNLETPILSNVKISFLPTNLAPAVYTVEISQEDSNSDELLKSFNPSLRRQDRKITWRAFDPNGDSLVFDLYFKGIEEKEWKLLKSDLSDKSYILDGELLPDGKYQVKVVASDKLSQPVNLALKGERESAPFDIDNTPPRVFDITANFQQKSRYLITFKVTDQSSIIKHCEYSINATGWQALAPEDKIFDSKTENFVFVTELSPGENTIVIRAADNQKNIGSGKIVVKVKK